MRIVDGLSCAAMAWSEASATDDEGMVPATRITGYTRVKLSMTVSARNRRPSPSESETKSMLQHSFGATHGDGATRATLARRSFSEGADSGHQVGAGDGHACDRQPIPCDAVGCEAVDNRTVAVTQTPSVDTVPCHHSLGLLVKGNHQGGLSHTASERTPCSCPGQPSRR